MADPENSSSVVPFRKANPINTNLKVALAFAGLGIPVFPCDPSDKAPRVQGDWRNSASIDEAQVKKWWKKQPDSIPAFSPGMVGLLVVDCDRHGGPDGVEAFAALSAEHGDADHITVGTPSGGVHVYMRQNPDAPLGNSSRGLPSGIDVRGVGGYVITPGALLPDGRSYAAADPATLLAARTIPEWLATTLNNNRDKEPAAKPGPVTERERAYAQKAMEGCCKELSSAGEGGRNSLLNAITYRLGRMGGAGWIGQEKVETALLDACETNGLLADDGGDRKARATIRSGWRAGERDPHPALPDTGMPYSEISLALRFAERYSRELRFIDDRGRWMGWDGKRWTDSKRYSAFTRVQQLCRDAAAEALACKAVDMGGARKIESGHVVTMVEKLARADPRLNVTSDMLDQHDWLLNTPGGVVDLRTGEIFQHDPDLLITKIAHATPDPHCPTPAWDAFQKRIAGGDQELVAFKLRWYGYSLTGVTREQKFVFGWGEGGNGKGTEASVVAGIMDDYSRVVPIMTLVQQRYDGHPTDLAGLAGARLVTASETPEGMNWDEVKIKTLTGGDKVTARFMRGDFFDFWPKFKLTVHGNNKPGLKSVDEAIRRRVLLVPYSVTISAHERDPELGEKLKAEWSGILHKLVQGALEWQQIGLAAPQAVIDATNAYLDDQDLIGQFLDEWCVTDLNGAAQSSELFEAWKEFCEEQGRRNVGQQKDFNDTLEKRGFEKQHGKKGKKFLGLRLIERERRTRADKAETISGGKY